MVRINAGIRDADIFLGSMMTLGETSANTLRITNTVYRDLFRVHFPSADSSVNLTFVTKSQPKK